MRTKSRHALWTLGALVACVLLVWSARSSVAAVQDSQQPGPERFRAVAANLGRVRGPMASEVDIDVQRWSTDGQREQLVDILKSKGEQALLDTLQKQPVVGTIRTPDSLAYDLHYARVQPWDDGGQQIILATDRPIEFWETRNDSRSLNYPFTVIEMCVNGEGKGQGTMSVATRVIPAGNQIILENYNQQPVMLTEITREK